MKFPVLITLLAIFPMAAVVSAAEEAPAATPKPKLLDKLLHTFSGSKDKDKDKGKEVDVKGTHLKHLELSLKLEPKVLKLSETRQFTATLTLVNHGKQMAQLEFPTSQRIEVLVKNKDGKLVEQWSEDQAFVNEPSLVAINPNERVEYTANLSTRDFVAGETYQVEAFFPNFEPLKSQEKISPVK